VPRPRQPAWDRLDTTRQPEGVGAEVDARDRLHIVESSSMSAEIDRDNEEARTQPRCPAGPIGGRSPEQTAAARGARRQCHGLLLGSAARVEAVLTGNDYLGVVMPMRI
jgi:hypothetical protein